MTEGGGIPAGTGMTEEGHPKAGITGGKISIFIKMTDGGIPISTKRL